MRPFNATVTSGFVNRDGEFVHWVRPDKGAPVQIKFHTALPDGKRVKISGDRIEEVQ
jgi:hypothetical protein